MTIDLLTMVECPFFCRLGVGAEERACEQLIHVDVAMHVDTIAAIASDSIYETIDYAQVHRAITALLAAREFRLIETLADTLAQTVLAQFPRATTVTIRLRKHAGLARVGAAWTSVEVTRGIMVRA